MGRKYSIQNPDGIYFVTFTIVNWLKVFSIEANCYHFLRSVRYCQEHKGLEVHAYCIMPNHIHMIISTGHGFDLSGIIRDLKRHTSIAIRKELEGISGYLKVDAWMTVFKCVGEENPRNTSFQLWQQHNHPIELDSDYIYNQRLDYIHNNPVVAELVDDPVKWKWSSARAYECGEDSLIKLNWLE